MGLNKKTAAMKNEMWVDGPIMFHKTAFNALKRSGGAVFIYNCCVVTKKQTAEGCYQGKCHNIGRITLFVCRFKYHK